MLRIGVIGLGEVAQVVHLHQRAEDQRDLWVEPSELMTLAISSQAETNAKDEK